MGETIEDMEKKVLRDNKNKFLADKKRIPDEQIRQGVQQLNRIAILHKTNRLVKR